MKFYNIPLFLCFLSIAIGHAASSSQAGYYEILPVFKTPTNENVSLRYYPDGDPERITQPLWEPDICGFKIGGEDFGIFESIAHDYKDTPHLVAWSIKHNTVVGAAIFSINYSVIEEKPCNSTVLELLKVNDAWRNQKIGTTLISIVEKLARLYDSKELRLYSLLSTKEFYENLGFEEEESNKLLLIKRLRL